LVYLSLCPFIRLVQDNEIRSCFTEENWSALKEQILDDDLSQENKILIDLARQPLALLALSMAIRRLSVEYARWVVYKSGDRGNQIQG